MGVFEVAHIADTTLKLEVVVSGKTYSQTQKACQKYENPKYCQSRIVTRTGLKNVIDDDFKIEIGNCSYANASYSFELSLKNKTAVVSQEGKVEQGKWLTFNISLSK